MKHVWGVGIILLLLFYGCQESGVDVPVSEYLTVPADFTTIQLAIESATDGDTILVSPGRYVENIDFLGKSIVVAGQYLISGDTALISSTIIDGSDSAASVVNISGAKEDEYLGLIGLRVCNGRTGKGAGVNVSSCSPLLSNCLIDSNQAFGST